MTFSGLLKDAVGSFGPSIHICGILMFLGGGFFGLEPCARRLNRKKESEVWKIVFSEDGKNEKDCVWQLTRYDVGV